MPTFNGSSDHDSLVGSAGNDSLFGLSGDDTLLGGDGADYGDGGAGNDSLLGGAGNDTQFGSLGNDFIDGGADADSLFGDEGLDTLIGGSGNDQLQGNADNDSLDGGDGADLLSGGTGNDVQLGGLGNDTLLGGDGFDTLDGGAGDDVVQGGIDNDVLEGGDGADNISGAAGNDTLSGGAGNDTLFGEDGNDSLSGGDGNDTLVGGEGNNTLVGGAGIDRLFGGSGDDTYVLNGPLSSISDAGGNDKLIVNVDFVKVPVGAGIETVEYGAGVQQLPYWIDALLPDSGALIPTYAPSHVLFFAFPTSLPAYTGTEGSAADADGYTPMNAAQQAAVRTMLGYVASVFNVSFVETADVAQSNTLAFAFNNQTGSSGYAYFPSTASIGSDVFIAHGYEDLSNGSPGQSTLIHEIGHALGLKHPFAAGGDGPYLPSAEDNTAWTVMSYTDAPGRPADGNYSVLDIAALQYLYGPSTTGRTGNDNYQLSAAATNMIWDGAGTDALDASALAAAVTLYLEPGYWGFIGAKASTITAAGQVTVNFGSQIENAFGGSGADTLVGNALGNSISGGGGDDRITGGAGDDSLSGGAGNEIFAYAASGNGLDTISDFAPGDVIKLVGTLSTLGVTTGNGSTVGGRRVEAQTVAGLTTLFVDTDNLAGAEVQIRLTGNFAASGFTVTAGVDGTSNISYAASTGLALTGTAGPDDLVGAGAADTLTGLAGNDTLTGAAGNDTLDGGADIDTASYAGATGAVMAFLWNIQATGADGTDSLLNIENLMGSAFNDRLDGTNGANDLKAGDGNDSLFAYAGADTLTGGVGNDLIDGGADTDTASYAGATGAVTAFLWGDQATGADGTDILYNIENLIGSAFNDRLDGTNSANDLSGGAGNDSLYAYAGADTLTGGLGNDLMDGGADADTASYAGATGAVTVFLWGSQASGADGTDTLYNFENVIGSAFADRIDGTNNADGLNGGAGDDSLFGYGGTDTLTGGAGNDLISAGAGNDIIRFAASGNGIDSLTDFAIGDTLNIAALLSINPGGVTNGNGSTVSANGVQVSSVSGTTTLYIDTNNSAGAEIQISLSGSYSAANFAITANGDGTSNISLQVPQAITGTAGADALNGTSANDTLLGLAGNDTLSGGLGDDTIDGGADTDTANYAGATSAVTAYLWGNQVTGGDGTDALLSIENIMGSGFNDRLDGTNSANDLNGGAGNDSLYAYAGNDTLTGGAGNDLIDGGADTDTASYAGAASAVTVFLWGSQATGGDGTDAVYNFENVIGSAFNDRIDGTNTVNDLNGGAGNDSLYAYAGDDTLTGGAGNDLLDAGADIDTVSYAGAAGAITVFLWGSQASGADGADTLYNFEKVIGSAFNDRLDGTNSNDGLMGGAGNDSLNGYGGADTLEGGAGNDLLNGGAGADSYVFASASGLDTIQGFAVAEADKIQLASNLNGSGITTAAQALAATSYASGNAIVDLGAGNSVTLVGVAPGGLSAGDFVVG
jgi:Ca2+-binding RTX toxin-like protein